MFKKKWQGGLLPYRAVAGELWCQQTRTKKGSYSVLEFSTWQSNEGGSGDEREGQLRKQTQWARKYTHMLQTEQPDELLQCFSVLCQK